MTLHRFEQSIRALHDHLYANANIRTPEELQAEVAKLIVALARGKRDRLLSPLSSEDSRRLISGDEPTVARIADEIRVIHTLSDTATPIRLDDLSIAYARASLDSFDFSGHERDWLGDALEVFRSTAAKRLGGQFFTDQRVTDLAIQLLEYDPTTHDLVDICAGTGGFLIAGHKIAALNNVLEPRISGIEIDAKLANLGNSTLASFGLRSEAPTIHQSDSLRQVLPDDMHCLVRNSNVQRLASNPPFGIKITIKDHSILEQFELAKIWRKHHGKWEKTSKITARPPDTLFLERNLQLAEPGSGRVALVTPYQTLSGPRQGFVREWLLRNARILAVIDLPEDTFQPWTGTKTSLIVYERREVPLQEWDAARDGNYPVFMSIAEHIGHDRRGNPIQDDFGNIKTDIPSIAEAYNLWIDGKDPGQAHSGSFVISASEFNAHCDLRLNAAYHNPIASAAREILATDEGEKFEVVPLGNLVQRVFCPGRFRRNYVSNPDEGVLFLGGSNISQLVTTNKKYLARNDRHLSEMVVESGWVLVTRSGTTGIVSSVPEAWQGFAISEHVIRIVPNQELLPGGYLESYLRSELGQRLLAAGIFGSVIDEITPEYIARMPIPIPRDRSIMEKVAKAQDEANRFRNQAMTLVSSAVSAIDEFQLDHVA